jgi:hypothetical protein
MSLVPATDASPADWYVNADAPWYIKATYGPPGLQTYARVSLGRDECNEEDPSAEITILRSVVATLVEHTTTPHQVHVGVWEGWGLPEPQGVRFEIHARRYALLTGPAMDALDPGALGLDPRRPAIPHLLWPADRAWFIAWDVDEEWNFTVGGSARAVAALLAQEDITGTVVPYGTPELGWNW